MESANLTEVPSPLKKLVRLIARGFYSMEHAIIVDMLIRHRCVKEDDLADMLNFDRRHLRSILNTLKGDKLLKSRLRMETDIDGKISRHNHYYISYDIFVNIVKYKLDHIRKKIELEERNMSSRSSFKCPNCGKVFTDFEVGQMIDMASGKLLCTFCMAEVVEDESSLPQRDARTNLAQFNEQIQPIYDLLQECENIQLSQSLLEPEPSDLKNINRRVAEPNVLQHNADMAADGRVACRVVGFGYSESSITITVGEDGAAPSALVKKEAPVWMQRSTVDGVPLLDGNDERDIEVPVGAGRPMNIHNSEDIMQTLLVHEPKAGASSLPNSEVGHHSRVRLAGGVEDSGDMEEVDSVDDDDDDSCSMMTVGDRQVRYDDVTDELVSMMTPGEKEAYIAVGRRMYESYYD